MPPETVTVPAVEPAPVTDNCGLSPADMDDKTKRQCGLTVEEPAPGSGEVAEVPGVTEVPECSPGNELVPESPIGPYCDYAGDGSDEYQQYQDDTGYPYSEEEYDSLYGYQQCGTACGKEPTSGEVQQEYLCQQGYVTEGC